MSHRRYPKIDAWLREWESVFTRQAIADAIEMASRELRRERNGYETVVRGGVRFEAGERFVLPLRPSESVSILKVGRGRFKYKPTLPISLYSHQRAYRRYPWVDWP